MDVHGCVARVSVGQVMLGGVMYVSCAWLRTCAAPTCVVHWYSGTACVSALAAHHADSLASSHPPHAPTATTAATALQAQAAAARRCPSPPWQQRCPEAAPARTSRPPPTSGGCTSRRRRLRRQPVAALCAPLGRTAVMRRTARRHPAAATSTSPGYTSGAPRWVGCEVWGGRGLCARHVPL
jgi:hypothetical protein